MTHLAELAKRNLLRYRELLSAAHLTDAQATELNGLLAALRKTQADAEKDSNILLTARQMEDEMRASAAAVSDTARETGFKLADAQKRYKETVAKAQEQLRTASAADAHAHSAIVALSDKSQALAQLKQRSPHLFD